MAKRIITKIGDIFCVEVDNEYKCYFQYVANDMTVLNSSVIRVFSKHYPMDYVPVFDATVVAKILSKMMFISMRIQFFALEYYITHGIKWVKIVI